eukprot:c17026_g1_i1 orf=684-2540(+)
MVASSSCADSDCCAKASFESSGSIAGFSSSSSSSHQHHHVFGSNECASKLSCSSSSTDTTSRNSWERSLPILNNNSNITNINKPHKAHDGAWASIQSLKSKEGNLGIAHFKLLYRVGHGDIGRVFLAQLRGTHCLFAMKVMDKEALTQRKKVQRMHREREILEFVDHPFLPTLYAHFEADQFSCLVMDYCSGGDLHALRQKYPGRRFSMKAARFYAAEVLLALEYLHMLGIVYRDLKPENVLVRDDGHIMLTDFDLSFKCDVQPKLLKCAMSASSSSSSGRLGLLRSFSISSSMSSASTTSRLQQSSVNCTLPSACVIHPFLSCFANIGGKVQQAQKQHQKHPLAMLFLKQSVKMKPPKAEGVGVQSCTQTLQRECAAESVRKDEQGNTSASEDDKNVSLKTPESPATVNITIKGDAEVSTTDEGVAPRAENACIDEDLMGLELVAEPTQARSMSFVGTHEYLSPEMIAGQGHGNAVDWWTFGIFLFELIYGRTPFKGSCNEQTLLNIIRQELRFPEWGHANVGEHAKSLIEGLLVKDPRKRLGSIKGAGEIKQHPFFRGVNWALIRSTQPPEVPNNIKARPVASHHHQHHHHQHDSKSNVFTVNRAASKPLPHFDYF